MFADLKIVVWQDPLAAAPNAIHQTGRLGGKGRFRPAERVQFSHARLAGDIECRAEFGG